MGERFGGGGGNPKREPEPSIGKTGVPAAQKIESGAATLPAEETRETILRFKTAAEAMTAFRINNKLSKEMSGVIKELSPLVEPQSETAWQALKEAATGGSEADKEAARVLWKETQQTIFRLNEAKTIYSIAVENWLLISGRIDDLESPEQGSK